MQYVNRERTPLSQDEKRQRDAAKHKRDAEIRMRNNRLGVTLFQGSWIMVFVCLIVVYWQIGFSPGWRPEPAQAPNPLLPTLATLGLIASAWFTRRAWHRIRAAAPDDAAPREAFLQNWLLAIGLGVAFFVVMMSQYLSVPAADETQRFGTIYRLLIGYHALHAVVIGLMMVQVYRLGRAGRYHAHHHWPVEASKRLWDFVVVAWLLFYAVLYLPFLG